MTTELEVAPPVEETIREFTEADPDAGETREWIEALDDVIEAEGSARARYLLRRLLDEGHRRGVRLPFDASTPYVNTIPVTQEPPYPGDRALERRIKSLIRWNAMAMVVRANKKYEGLGGAVDTEQPQEI